MSAIVWVKDFLVSELCSDSESFVSVRTKAASVHLNSESLRNEPDLPNKTRPVSYNDS